MQERVKVPTMLEWAKWTYWEYAPIWNLVLFFALVIPWSWLMASLSAISPILGCLAVSVQVLFAISFGIRKWYVSSLTHNQRQELEKQKEEKKSFKILQRENKKSGQITGGELSLILLREEGQMELCKNNPDPGQIHPRKHLR